MHGQQRSTVVAGLILILIGAFSLVFQFVPALSIWLGVLEWPIYVLGVALLLLIIGVLTGAPGMAVPVCIVGGIGGLLSWQNVTGNWESWAYAWTLIPGFVGMGVVFSGLLGNRQDRWETVKGGLWSMLTSVVLFLIFGSFFGLPLLGDYWPVLLIGLGVLLLGRALWRGSR